MRSATSCPRLPRLHAPELMDQGGFPAALRHPMADPLDTVSVRQRLVEAAVPVLERGLARERHAWEVGALRRHGRPTVQYVLGRPVGAA